MRISFVAASAGLALLLALPTAAQTPPATKAPPAPSQTPPAPAAPATSAPPADAPMDGFTPPDAKKPSEGWTDAQKSADAVKAGQAMLTTTQKAYAATKELTQDIDLAMALPDGKGSEKMTLTFGSGNDMHMAARGIDIIVKDDMLYVVPEQPTDKYLGLKVTGTLQSTLETALPGFALPAPTLAFRQPVAGADLAQAFSMGAINDLKLVGSREEAGKSKELLLVGANGEATVLIDPATNFIKSYSLFYTPEGLPPAIKLAVDVALTNKTGALEKPIAFDPGKRTMVNSVTAMANQDPAPQNGGGVERPVPANVKAGDVAPLAKLSKLDGTMVDLADLKGKVIVIDFWATWCPPCRKGLPLLQQYATEVKSNDKVAVFAVDSSEQPFPPGTKPTPDEVTAIIGKVKDYWTKQKFTMDALVDPAGSFIEKYGFTGIPATVIIGTDGKIVSTHIGFNPDMVNLLRTEVTKALAAPAPTASAAK